MRSAYSPFGPEVSGCLHLVCCYFFFSVGLLCAELLHLGLIHNIGLAITPSPDMLFLVYFSLVRSAIFTFIFLSIVYVQFESNESAFFIILSLPVIFLFVTHIMGVLCWCSSRFSNANYAMHVINSMTKKLSFCFFYHNIFLEKTSHGH